MSATLPAVLAHDCPQDRTCKHCGELVCAACAGRYEPEFEQFTDGHIRDRTLVLCVGCEAARVRA